MRTTLFPSADALGIAIGEHAMTIAEVRAGRGGGQLEVRRTATFELDAAAAASPESIGQALSQFLRRHRFRAARVVLGVPARWLVARERDLPPSTPEQAAGMLRLQAERLFSSELKDLVFDYAGTPDPSQPRRVLLTAMPRQQLDRIVAVADAAGLRVHSVVPTVLALSATSADQAKDAFLLSLTPESAELLARSDGTPRLLRHLAVRGPDLASQNGTRVGAMSALAGELKRVVALTPGSAERTVVMWDGIGLAAEESAALAEHAGIRLQPHTDIATAQPLTTTTEQNTHFAHAIALALLAAKGEPPPVDFMNPRLAAPRVRRLGRRAVWGTVLGAVAVLGIGGLIFDVRSHQNRLDRMTAQFQAMEPEMKAAESAAQRLSTGRGWFDARPQMLEILREVTLAFRDDEPIYVTNLTLRDSGNGTLAGKASDDKYVLAVLQRLKSNPRFTEVNFQSTQDAGGTSREVSYSLNFIFTGAEVAK